MHEFIFVPGFWEGSGAIRFTMADDVLNFHVTWTVLPAESWKIYFSQEIAIESLPEKMRNTFCLLPCSPTTFDIQLENDIVGKVVGSGVMTPSAIAWEFRRRDQEFQGFELYELQKDGSYKMQAEFTAGGGMGTHITGTLSRHS